LIYATLYLKPTNKTPIKTDEVIYSKVQNISRPNENFMNNIGDLGWQEFFFIRYRIYSFKNDTATMSYRFFNERMTVFRKNDYPKFISASKFNHKNSIKDINFVSSGFNIDRWRFKKKIIAPDQIT
jgi:hypothetical protein